MPAFVGNWRTASHCYKSGDAPLMGRQAASLYKQQPREASPAGTSPGSAGQGKQGLLGTTHRAPSAHMMTP
jgi:hypothetical protein